MPLKDHQIPLYAEVKSEVIIAEVEKARKEKVREPASKNELQARRFMVEDFLKGLMKRLSKEETKDSFLELMRFYFSNPPHKAFLTAQHLLKFLETVKKGGKLLLKQKAFQIVKEELKLDAENLLELKDQTNLTDEAIGVWIKKLDGLTCKSAELDKLMGKQKELFMAALKPTETPDGYAINFPNLLYLLQPAYPCLLGEEMILGINMDATEMGGEKTTAASVRALNEVLDFQGVEVNSSRNEYFFVLYHGEDDAVYLRENVFRNEDDGK